MVRAMAGGSVAMAVRALHARQQTVEGGHEVVVRARSDLDDDEPGRGVRDEDRQETVAVVIGRLGGEGDAGGGEVVQAAAASGVDGQFAGLYGKMLRRASRSRPIPPPTGADS